MCTSAFPPLLAIPFQHNQGFALSNRQFIIAISGEVVKHNGRRAVLNLNGWVNRKALFFFFVFLLLLFIIGLRKRDDVRFVLRKVDGLLSTATRALNWFRGLRRGTRSSTVCGGTSSLCSNGARRIEFGHDSLRSVLRTSMEVKARGIGAPDVDVDVLGFLELGVLNVAHLPFADRGLVRLAREEHGAVADTEGALLLLALGIDFGNGPCLDGVGLRFVGCGGDSVGRVDVCADGACRFGWLTET